MISIETAFEFLEKANRISLGLDVIRELTEKLGNPQNKLKNIIHIAGTNGKGSTGAFIESALIEGGFSVGRYSSPAVFSYFEIFRKNGRNITETEYCNYMEKIMNVEMTASPTSFEIETALAFLFMSDCDYCIIETGLGGREDATNVIDIEKLAVFTSISLDHMQFLGDTVEQIAAEKCGIINNKTTVISSVQKESVKNVICSYAKTPIFAHAPRNIKIHNGFQIFDCGDFKNIKINLLGSFQPINASTALTVLQNLNISEEIIRRGFEKATWHGRFDILSQSPIIIADGAHNRDAFLQLKNTLTDYFPNKKFNFITGVLRDKDYAFAAELFSPLAKNVYTVTPDNPRSLINTEYAKEFKKHGITAVPVEINKITEIIDKNEINVIFGSLSFMKALPISS